MEKWVKIKGYDYYEISTDGKVRSNFSGTKKELKTTISKKNGNRRVKLYNNGIYNTFNISTIMGKVFFNKSNMERIYHINGIITDDRLKNLTIYKTGLFSNTNSDKPILYGFY